LQKSRNYEATSGGQANTVPNVNIKF